jgi:hypothetical protein
LDPPQDRGVPVIVIRRDATDGKVRAGETDEAVTGKCLADLVDDRVSSGKLFHRWVAAVGEAKTVGEGFEVLKKSGVHGIPPGVG